MRQAVILAGGFGTRLGTLTRSTPKPLLPVAGRPFLRLLVDEVRRQGVDAVLIVAGFCGDAVVDAFAGDPATAVVVEPAPMGTGGALRFAGNRLADEFFFMNGDSLYDINLDDLAMRGRGRLATLALRPMADVARYGPAELDGQGRIVRFAERPQQGGPGLINGGVGWLSRHILDHIPPGIACSIERDVYPVLADRRELHGQVYDAPFLDIGVPDDYARAQDRIPAILRRGAVIFDRDGVLNEDIGYAHRPDQIRWIEGAKAAVKRVNDAGLLALVATNQGGIAHGYYSEEDMHRLHDWMQAELRKTGARIDGFAFCPFHPEGVVDAYRGHSSRRKPEPDMLVELIADHNVDPFRCIMIGDKQTDMEAAERAGVGGRHYAGGNLLDIVERIVRELVSDCAAGDGGHCCDGVRQSSPDMAV